MSARALEAWLAANAQYPANPSSPHRLGQRAEAALNQARERLAGFLGCHPLEILWTSGATESANHLFFHLARASRAPARVWISAIEHPCVLESARRYFPGRLRLIPVTPDGVADLEWMRHKLRRRRPALVAVMAANNETGVLQPWEAIAALCREHRIPFFTDAVQWLGRQPAAGLGQADFVSGSAHKFGGPRGIGFLKSPSQGPLHPLLVGGPQEDGRRAGTENVAGALAFVDALEERERQLAHQAEAPLRRAKEEFERRLAELPGCEIVGRAAPRLWNTTMVLLPPAPCRLRPVVQLDKFGFAVSTGSACASGKAQPSHVLAALGFGAAAADRALRFSAGWETPLRDWQKLFQALKTMLRQA